MARNRRTGPALSRGRRTNSNWTIISTVATATSIKATIVAEILMGLSYVLRLLASYFVIVVGSTLFVWILFWIFDRTSFLEWSLHYWYLIVFIALAFGYLFRSRLRIRSAKLCILINRSNRIPPDWKTHIRSKFKVGGVRIGASLLGPMTVAASPQGIYFIETSRPKAVLDWEAIESIDIYRKDSGGSYARLQLLSDSNSIEILWDASFDRFVPAKLQKKYH